ncbi:hypothetical protein PJL18_04086 [Paenarthrobacter nicotinovorans]|nr:hypothetical protein [Paenarthrobacter nicotinovorans]
MVSPVTTTTGWPVRCPISASPIPVLPDVLSTMVAPGLSSPERSAARTILSAVRSLMEPPGFSDSSLTWMTLPSPRLKFSSLTSGVFPTFSRTEASRPSRPPGSACNPCLRVAVLMASPPLFQ